MLAYTSTDAGASCYRAPWGCDAPGPRERGTIRRAASRARPAARFRCARQRGAARTWRPAAPSPPAAARFRAQLRVRLPCGPRARRPRGPLLAQPRAAGACASPSLTGVAQGLRRAASGRAWQCHEGAPQCRQSVQAGRSRGRTRQPPLAPPRVAGGSTARTRALAWGYAGPQMGVRGGQRGDGCGSAIGKAPMPPQLGWRPRPAHARGAASRGRRARGFHSDTARAGAGAVLVGRHGARTGGRRGP